MYYSRNPACLFLFIYFQCCIFYDVNLSIAFNLWKIPNLIKVEIGYFDISQNARRALLCRKC